jgi:cobalamin-dependent methionine synthase I
MLAQCDSVAVLACTLGVRFDAMLRAQQARDMAQAVMLDACGSALVESGCNKAEEEIQSRFPQRHLTDRFSPGYGDLPLSLQAPLCAALDAGRLLGVTVGESCLINPCKTVTAFIGLSDKPQQARIRGCDYCAMRETCQLRKGGKRCGT